MKNTYQPRNSALCPVCGERITVLPTQKFRKHPNARPTCAGSGRVVALTDPSLVMLAPTIPRGELAFAAATMADIGTTVAEIASVLHIAPDYARALIKEGREEKHRKWREKNGPGNESSGSAQGTGAR